MYSISYSKITLRTSKILILLSLLLSEFILDCIYFKNYEQMYVQDYNHSPPFCLSLSFWSLDKSKALTKYKYSKFSCSLGLQCSPFNPMRVWILARVIVLLSSFDRIQYIVSHRQKTNLRDSWGQDFPCFLWASPEHQSCLNICTKYLPFLKTLVMWVQEKCHDETVNT